MARNNPDFLCRIYVWSILFEPLLFFVLAGRSVAGIGGNVSRIFQFIVIIILIFKGLGSGFRFKASNPFSPLYRNYTIYLILVVISGLIGILSGAYSIDYNYNREGQSQISQLLNNPFARPLFEYFITIYYFIYFGVLPKYLIKSEEGINYFFKLFQRTFILCLILGYLDLILVGFGYKLIPRQIFEGVYVGFRWHGFAGEPRDAFVYLLFGLAMLNLQQYWNNRSTINKKWIVLIFITLILTQSASGFLGLLFSGVLIFIFEAKIFSLKRFAISVLIIGTLVLVTYIGVTYGSRAELRLYIERFADTWNSIGERHNITGVFSGQMVNIYPLWDIVNSIQNLNIFPVLFGNGLGTASVITNQLGDYKTLMNPASQLVRLMYESGVIGVILFTYAFVSPIRRLTMSHPKKIKRLFLILLLLLIGGFFGHRTAVLFIYFGIFTLVFDLINKEHNKVGVD